MTTRSAELILDELERLRKRPASCGANEKREIAALHLELASICFNEAATTEDPDNAESLRRMSQRYLIEAELILDELERLPKRPASGGANKKWEIAALYHELGIHCFNEAATAEDADTAEVLTRMSQCYLVEAVALHQALADQQLDFS